jgi:hypothetical protein
MRRKRIWRRITLQEDLIPEENQEEDGKEDKKDEDGEMIRSRFLLQILILLNVLWIWVLWIFFQILVLLLRQVKRCLDRDPLKADLRGSRRMRTSINNEDSEDVPEEALEEEPLLDPDPCLLHPDPLPGPDPPDSDPSDHCPPLTSKSFRSLSSNKEDKIYEDLDLEEDLEEDPEEDED